MPPTRKVFLSYRSVDRERVRAVAEELRKAGIDAWWDAWEILPSDNFVAKINQALEQCDCGVVFLSSASFPGTWQAEEITILKSLFIDEKRPLIPVLLDSGVAIPPILRVHSRLTADQIPQLIDAIHGRTSKPELGPGRPARACLRFSILLRELPDQAIGVGAQLDGKPLIPELPVHPGPSFHFSYSDFLKHMPAIGLGSPKEIALARRRELEKLGDAVGRIVFADSIAAELSSRLAEAERLNHEIELIYEAAAPRLLSIPFEAARLPDGRIPALSPGVFAYRRLSPDGIAPLEPRSPPAGPLRVLVAVGAPDEGKTPNSVLNSERELETIFKALDIPQRLGNAYVRVLEVASPEQIGAALRERAYHVLHLSGHGNTDALELEDEDGNPVPINAAQLAGKIRDSGHAAPLVFLASCQGGLAGQESAGFAHGLLENGVPCVLAMQTSVSDQYSTDLAGQFYGQLALAECPLASRALAVARRALEESAYKTAALPEYATPSLFLRGEEPVVLDRGLPQEVLQAPRAPAVSGAVPLLKLGELIGRRRQARQIVRVLTGHAETEASIGRKAGCQILGTGGVGKSSLAGRAMQRMAERGWPVATVSGIWNLGSIAAALGSALREHPQKDLAELAHKLNDPQAPDDLRLTWLQSILAAHDVLLVLDNFEDVLTEGGAAFRDPVTQKIFSMLLHSAQCAKLLVTSRYPVPGAQDYLHPVNLGPLSPAEVRKLVLRHEGLKRQSPEGLQLIERAIGGHPRTLEYLDALLRNGNARFPWVQERLREYASRAGVSLESAGDLEERVRDAIQVAAADALVEELVRLIGQTPGDLEVLWQASVFPFAVPIEALAAGAAVVNRLVASSLLAIQEDRSIVVHRWTAESLKSHMSAETYQACCRRAAEYLEKRPVPDRRQWVTDLTEGTRLFLAAREFDRAAELTWQLLNFLRPYGQTTVWTELAREVSAALPADHEARAGLIGVEGDGLRSLGFTNRALERYGITLKIFERLVQQEPGRAGYLRDLSVANERMGDLHRALGQGQKARQFYEKALAFRERLVRQEPGRADYLRDLSVSYERMGDLHRELGQGETARQFYEKDLEIAERLAKQEPGRGDYLRDLSVSYERMGDLHRELGQGATARQFYEKALEFRERLVEQEPGRADYLRDLSVSCNKLGDLHLALGQGETARQFYEKFLEIAERLVKQEPGRADYIRDLSVSYNKLGDLHTALGQGETARQFYERHLEIAERLVKQEPGRADYLRDLSVSYNNLGDLNRALGQEETARQFYEQALKIREQLAKQEPGRADYLRDLSVSYNKLGDLHSALGEGETARQFYENALHIAERLVNQEPGRADYLRDLSVSYNNLGDLHTALGQEQPARHFYEQALEIAQRLVKQEPGRADHQLDLVRSLARMADPASLRRALDILADLQKSNRLMPQDLPLIAFIQKMLHQTETPHP